MAERAEPIDVTDGTFESEVINSQGPVVVEFWSPECTHCQHMTGIVASLAKEMDGKAKVVKVEEGMVMTLEPGDLILTGTPSGVSPLVAGDVVEAKIEGLGELRNPVAAEPPHEYA